MNNRWLKFAELIDAYRIVPRLILLGYAIMVWDVVSWYMALAEPSTQHAALVTVAVSIVAPIAGLYQNSGRKWNDEK